VNATAEAIAKASATARAKMGVLEQDTIQRLTELYQGIADRLASEIKRYADADGNLRLEVLRDYLKQAQAALGVLRLDRNELLGSSLRDAAELGASVWLTGPAVAVVAESAVRFAEQFIAADGLRLSDRLWRIDNGAIQAISDTLRRNIALGRDASAAAADLLARGEAIPPELKAQIGQQHTGALAKAVDSAISKAPNNAYANALRVFRTELNRAHGQAYQAGAGSHPDVIGMKFNLSLSHPRVDQCDFHAHANLHGLGEGVYPVGQSPWPAHPNTMSYLTAVFKHEVSAQDRAGKQSRLDWLQAQPALKQDQLLGQSKAAALRAGVLADTDINTPWRDLKDAYEQRGYRFD
jgi:hypothetical protein